VIFFVIRSHRKKITEGSEMKETGIETSSSPPVSYTPIPTPGILPPNPQDSVSNVQPSEKLQTSISTSSLKDYSNPSLKDSSNPSLKDSSNLIRALTNVRIIKKLGAGDFGEVYVADWNGTPVALKKLGEKGTLSSFLSEVDMLASLNHPNIVRLLGTYTDDDNGDQFLVTEYCKQGSLLNTLQTRPLSLLQLLKVASESAKGMVYLESNKVLHRDLAARNILMDDIEHIKIGDFGLSRTAEAEYLNATDKIPIRWSAPELFQRKPYTTKSDVWSFGVVLWEIFSRGQQPYSWLSATEVGRFVCGGKRLPKLDTIPDPIWELINKCWESEPSNRPSFSVILKTLRIVKKEILGNREESFFL